MLSGNLLQLLNQGSKSLEILTLSDCQLKPEDLTCLAQAATEGSFPKLKHLDLSHNNVAGYIKRKKMTNPEFMHLFDGPCKWNQLFSLDIRKSLIISSIIDFMEKVKKDGLLGNVRELGIDIYPKVNTKWPLLRTLYLSSCESDSLHNIERAVGRGFFPALCKIYTEEFAHDDALIYLLSQRNINCHKTFPPFDNQFTAVRCYCQWNNLMNSLLNEIMV